MPILYTHRCPSSSCTGRYEDIFGIFVVICRDKKHHMNHGLDWDEDYLYKLIANRLREEALEETDDLKLANEFEKGREVQGPSRKDQE